MELIISSYVIFCITTAVVFMWNIISPILSTIYKVESPKPALAEHSKFIVYFAFTIVCLIFAPFLFIIYLSKDMTQKFIEHMLADFLQV